MGKQGASTNGASASPAPLLTAQQAACELAAAPPPPSQAYQIE